jgi:hypothetical protein
MTHHDKVRQTLHDSGFRSVDGRSALEMTDEEVEVFVVEFIKRMTAVHQQLNATFRSLAQSIVKATDPLRNLAQLLAEADQEASSSS